MTQQDMGTLISSWLDDTGQTYFTTTQIYTWINLAQRQVQMELIQAGQNWYQIPVETTTVYGQSDYVLPSDFLVLHRLEIITQGTGVNETRVPVTQMTTNSQDMVSIGLGIPTNFYIKKDRITLSPTPNAAYTMRMYYSYRVADLVASAASTNVPDVPEQFMEYCAILAAFDGFIKDDRAPENLLQKKVKYEDMLKRMATDRLQDRSRMIIPSGDYETGSIY